MTPENCTDLHTVRSLFLSLAPQTHPIHAPSTPPSTTTTTLLSFIITFLFASHFSPFAFSSSYYYYYFFLFSYLPYKILPPPPSSPSLFYRTFDRQQRPSLITSCRRLSRLPTRARGPRRRRFRRASYYIRIYAWRFTRPSRLFSPPQFPYFVSAALFPPPDCTPLS